MTSLPGDPTGGVGRARTDLLDALKNGRIRDRDERLRAAATLFEGVLTAELFKAMRETVPEGGAVSGGRGEEIFSGLLDQHLADAAASASDRGIGEALYRHFTSGGVAHQAPDPGTLQQSRMGAEERGNGGRVSSARSSSESDEAVGAAGTQRAGESARGVPQNTSSEE